MAKAISSLLVQIGADTGDLERGGARASKSMDSLGKKAGELSSRMAALGAAAVAAGAAMVAGLVKSGLDSIDAQAKLARGIGSTIDGLRALQLAAGEAGVSNEALAKATQQLNARLGEAQRGTGQAKKSLDILGLSAAALSQMDADVRIATLADRIKEMGLSTSQTADVLRNFGIRGGEMVDILRQGGDVFRAARADVDAFGLSISAIDAAKVEMANDAMGRIGLTMEAIKNQLAIAFAPILKELADRFNNLAKENKGFGTQALQVAETIIRSFAKVADVIQGLRVVFKGVELVAVGFGAAFASVGEAILSSNALVLDSILWVINRSIDGLNLLGADIKKIPSIGDSPFMQGIHALGDAARDKVGEVRAELHALAMQEMPGAKVLAFLEDVKARAQEAAVEVAAAQSGGGTFESEDESAKKEEERAAKELEKQREILEAKLQQIREFAMTEEEEEIYRHEQRIARLVEGLEAELLTQTEYRDLEATLEEEHVKRLAEIRKKGMTDIQKFTTASYSKQVGMVAGYMADITAGVARENKAMFEINKAAGIANAIVAAYEGISKTLGAYPYPINIALAAAHAVAAFAQVRAISGQSFSGGGTAAPSLAGGTPATPVTPVTGGTPESAGGGGSLLTVEGVDPDSLFSGRAVRVLAERLQEHMRDGGRVAFA